MIGAALNLSGHSWLQRDNRGVESAGRRRAELLFMPFWSGDTPRHDTPTACGTALRHKRAAKHPTNYTIWFFFFFLDHWITKLCGLLLFSIYYSPYFIFSFSPLCLLWGCTPEKSLWSFSRPQTVREGLKRILLIFLIYRLYLLCSLSNNYLIN